MKHQIVAAFFAFLAGAVSGQIFEINGGRDKYLTESDMLGVGIPVILKVPFQGEVVVNFESTSTAFVEDCQWTFGPDSAGRGYPLMIYPIRAIVPSYQIIMNIYVTKVMGLAGGTCIWSTQTITLKSALSQGGLYPVIDPALFNPATMLCTFNDRRNIQTFDGSNFQMDDIQWGEFYFRMFTLFQTNDFDTSIQGSLMQYNNAPGFTYNTILAIKFFDSFLEIYANGRQVSPKFIQGNSPGAITYNCDNNLVCQIILTNGIFIQTNSYRAIGDYWGMNIQIKVPLSFRYGVFGLCGNFNGWAGDDVDDRNYYIFARADFNYPNALSYCENHCAGFSNAARPQNAVTVPVMLGRICPAVPKPDSCSSLTELTSISMQC